jgi:uncharacterized protein
MSDPNSQSQYSNPQPEPTPNPIPAPVTPQPVATVGPERAWEVGCHLAGFAGFISGIGWILGPLIVWLLKKDEFPSVDAHGKEELNFQISMVIYYVGLIVAGFFTCGVTWFAMAALGLVHLVIAVVKASDGQLFRYPFILRLIS